MSRRLVKSATLLAVTSSLLAEAGVAPGDHVIQCVDHGCYHRYDKSMSCQCNKECVKYKDCCPDYYHMCEETEYSKSGRTNPDKTAPLPGHHKNTPGKDFTTGFIRNIKIGGVVDGRLIIGYQGLGKIYVREHHKDHDRTIKEIRGRPPRPQGPGMPLDKGVDGPNRVEQIRKWGDRSCWYAEFPAPSKLPAEISVDGHTHEHAGSRIHGKVTKPDVEAHIYARIGEDGKVEFARNRNFEPATLHLDNHPIPIGEKYQDHPKPMDKKIEL